MALSSLIQLLLLVWIAINDNDALRRGTWNFQGQ